MKKLKISELFPHYVLSENEAMWVRKFYGHFCFEPLKTYEVIDRNGFVEMVNFNLSFVEEWVSDGIRILEKTNY